MDDVGGPLALLTQVMNRLCPIKYARICHFKQSVCVINSLTSERWEWNFRLVRWMLILAIDGQCLSCEIDIRWLSLDLTAEKSTVVQVMAWYRQATSHYLSQSYPIFVLLNGVTRPQSVKIISFIMLNFEWVPWWMCLFIQFKANPLIEQFVWDHVTAILFQWYVRLCQNWFFSQNPNFMKKRLCHDLNITS